MISFLEPYLKKLEPYWEKLGPTRAKLELRLRKLAPILKERVPYLGQFIDTDPKVRAHITVKGRIFEGSYHVYVEQQARNYGIRGWLKVRDALTSSAFLELEVEAPDPTMQNFILDLRKGVPDSHVTLVTVGMKPAGQPPFTSFRRLL